MPVKVPPQQVIDAFTSAVPRHTRRVEIYEADGETRWTKDTVSRLKDGSVNVKYDQDERRSIDLTLSNSDRVLVNAPGEFWYDKIIKVFRGVKVFEKSTLPSIMILTADVASEEVAELRRAIRQLGFGKIRVSDSVSTLFELRGYDIFVNMMTDVPEKIVLSFEAYNEGISVLTFGNGNVTNFADLFGTGATDTAAFEIYNDTSVAPLAIRHPVATGWSQFSYPNLNDATNLVPNGRGEGSSSMGTIWENVLSNPRGRDTSGTVVVRENLATNPRGTASGAGFNSNNGAYWPATKGVPIDDHPLGITTAVEQHPTEGVATATVVSLYNVDGLGDSTIERGLAAWVKVNTSGYEARFGSTRTRFPIPANEWTFVRDDATTVDSWGGFQVVKAVGTGNADPGDQGWVTGVLAVPGRIVTEDYCDGDYSPDTDLTPAWTGTAGASTSQLTAPSPTGWIAATGGLIYYSERYDAIAIYNKDKTNCTARTNPDPTFTAGDLGTCAIEYLSPTGGDVQVRTGGSVVNVGNSTATLAADEWTTIWRGFESTGGIMALYIYNSHPAGSTIYTRAAVVPGTDTYSGPRFDSNDESFDPDLDATWSGDPNKSSSQLVAPIPSGWNTIGKVYYSRTRECIAMAASFDRPNRPYIVLQGPPGAGNYTQMAEMVDTSDGQPVTMNIYRLSPTQQTVISVGSGEIIYNPVTSDSAGGFVWLAETDLGDRTVYFRAALIDGVTDYSGPWFDGKSYGGRWTGTAFQSPSVYSMLATTVDASTINNEHLTVISLLDDTEATAISAIRDENKSWLMYHLPVTPRLFEEPQFRMFLLAALNWTNPVEPIGTWEVQIGEFMIDRITEAHWPHEMKITGRDYTKKCLKSKYAHATQFDTGERLEDVIAAIAGAAGITKRILPTTGVVIGRDFFFDRGVSRWEAMKELTDAYNYELYFDATGYLVMRPYNDPSTTAPGIYISTGKDGVLASYEKSTSDSRIFNHVIVIGESSDSGIEPIWAERKNEDPNSPTNIDAIGDRITEYSSSFITTQAQADELADTLLANNALEEYELSFDSLVFPWLEVGDIIGWIDPNPAPDDPDTFLLADITIPLKLGPMSASARRVIKIGE